MTVEGYGWGESFGTGMGMCGRLGCEAVKK